VEGSELSKQLQDLHIDVALLSETRLKLHEMFITTNNNFYRTDRYAGRKGGKAVAVRKGIPPQTRRHTPIPVSIEETGVCIPIGCNEVLLATVYKSPGRAWTHVDIIELLSFKRKTTLVADLNAKNPFWNSKYCNPSGENLWALFNMNKFEISAPQCPIHYSPCGKLSRAGYCGPSEYQSVRCHCF
jgi:hypothetical protein